MNNRLDWNDFQTVLRIAEAGTLSGAAIQAGSSHPTMFRKINAVEEKLGVRLFERFRTGYQLTAAGEEVAATAREMASLANTTEKRVAGRDLRPSGTVRMATTDSLFYGLLAPLIAHLRHKEPEITLDVTLSNEVTDLSARETDIAIRPAIAPEEHLVGRRLGVVQQAVYGSQSLGLAEIDGSEWATLPWIGPSASMPYPQLHVWMRKLGFEKSYICEMDSVLGMHAAVRAGIGVAILPCYLAEPDAKLRRIGTKIEELATDLWLLTHPDLRHTARVRAVLEFFGDAQKTIMQSVNCIE